MAPSERLEAADVRLLVLSCLAGVGTATFVVGCVYAHYDLTQRLEQIWFTIRRQAHDLVLVAVMRESEKLRQGRIKNA